MFIFILYSLAAYKVNFVISTQKNEYVKIDRNPPLISEFIEYRLEDRKLSNLCCVTFWKQITIKK